MINIISFALGSLSPTHSAVNGILNILLVVTIVYAILLYMNYWNRRLEEKRVRNGVQKKGKMDTVIRNTGVFKSFYNKLYLTLEDKGKENLAAVIFMLIWIPVLFITITFIYLKIYILAIAFPIITYLFGKKILNEMSVSWTYQVEKDMPSMIDNLIRVFTTFNDIKTIIYETAKGTKDGAMKDMLNELSQKMNTESPKTALEGFIRKNSNIWINSLGFTLISYLEDADKPSTLQNLRHLRNMLQEQNMENKKTIMERKYGVMMNYALAVAGGLLFFANLIFNPIGTHFFFHTFIGLTVLVLGISSILGTILFNIRMTKIKK